MQARVLAAPMRGVLNVGLDLVQVWARQRSFIFQLAKREVVDRFKGSVFGAAWALAHPLALMGVYLFVFCTIFRLRMPAGMTNNSVDYAAFFVAGYLPWMVLQEAMTKGCSAIVGNQNLVKQVVFPLEVLPLRTALASLFPHLVGTGVLLIYLAIHGGLHWTLVLWPIALLLLTVTAAGLAMLLSTLTVFFQDTREFLSVVVMMGFYIMPIIYLPGMAPPWAERLILLNPLGHFCFVFRDVLVLGEITRPTSWVVATVTAGVLALAGHGLFRKLKGFFGNYL